MAKKKSKKNKNNKRQSMSRFERLLYSFTLVVVAISPLAIVFSQATLSKVNYDVEKIKTEIETQEKTNESLTMKISELASLDNIQEVADSEGLSYNNDNIKSISE